MAFSVIAAKAIAAVLFDEKHRKTAGRVVAIALSPLVFLIILICALLSGMSDHNAAAVDACFYGAAVSQNAPAEYREHVADMRLSLTRLDTAIANISTHAQMSGSLDPMQVKSVFYALFFGTDTPSQVDHRQFVDCFVNYEEHTTSPENEDDVPEYITVAYPVTDTSEIFRRIAELLGTASFEKSYGNAHKIYALAKYGPGAIDAGEFGDPGEPIGDGSYQALIQEGEKYLGLPMRSW